MESVSFGTASPDVLSSLAVRLSRLDGKLKPEVRKELVAEGVSLPEIARQLVVGADVDEHFRRAQKGKKERGESDEPSDVEVAQAAEEMCREAVAVLRRPDVRNAILRAKNKNEIVIDIINPDTLMEADMDISRAREAAESFRQYIHNHQDEITALQILFGRSRKERLNTDHLRELVEKMKEPPLHINEETAWTAFMTLQERPLRNSSATRQLTDLVMLVRHATGEDAELHPFQERVKRNFDNWLAAQKSAGQEFNDEQIAWLQDICAHVAGNFSLEVEDWDIMPFIQKGGLGGAHEVFGDELDTIITELNEHLVA